MSDNNEESTLPKGPFSTPEDRHRMIELRAYIIALKTGFKGDPVECWLEAEKRVDADLAQARKLQDKTDKLPDQRLEPLAQERRAA